MKKLSLQIIDQNNLQIQLKARRRVIDYEPLTISQNLDNMLIVAIDKLLARNRMNRLSLKSFKILGKIRPEAVSGMIIKTIKTALEI